KIKAGYYTLFLQIEVRGVYIDFYFLRSENKSMKKNASPFLKKKNLYRISVIVVIIVAVIVFLNKLFPTHYEETAVSSDKIISGTFDKSKFKSDAQWKKILTQQQYTILRQAGTEVPFTGKLEYENRKGTYYSIGCNEPIFRSEQKYDSG